MTYPSFSTGDVLTASDMNAVGLWKITNATATFTGGTAGSVSNGTVTVGTSNTAVTVSSAFSSTYNNYLIVVNGGAGSASNALRLTLGSTTTGYYYAGKGRTYAGVDSNIDNNNVNGWWYAGETAANGMTGVINVIDPNVAGRSQYMTTWAAPRTDGYFYSASGFLDNATQYTAFTITFGTGSQTGGTIRIYGYRN